MASSPVDIIVGRRSKRLKDKESMFKLLKDSYAGGYQYKEAGHLSRYIREGTNAYKARLERAVYFNHTQPLVDLLIGFIFTNMPSRQGFGLAEYMIQKAGINQSLDEFMMNVATQSIMMTSGVLVDSPKFDAEQIKTKRDRDDNGVNPYCLLYDPLKIRDFCLSSKGEIEWILLDNTYTSNIDPFAESKTIKEYRLWTKTYYQDFSDKYGDFRPLAKVDHFLGEVPFIFVNWRDNNQDMIDDTIFEDIALYDKAIYNFTSCLDEMIVSGTFKMLFFPAEDIEEDIPAEIKNGGISELTVIPYRASAGKPFFDGAGLQDAQPFIAVIEMYMDEILKKIGVEDVEKQSIVKTGVARRYDFQKTKAYLVSGIRQLEKVEKEIVRLANKWEGREITKQPEVIYSTDFLSEDLDVKLQRYASLMSLPYDRLSKSLHKLIIKNTLSNEVPENELDEILKQVEEDGDDVFKNMMDLLKQQEGEQYENTNNQ